MGFPSEPRFMFALDHSAARNSSFIHTFNADKRGSAHGRVQGPGLGGFENHETLMFHTPEMISLQ